MSRKTILLTAVILVVLLVAAAIGYKSLTAKQKQIKEELSGQTVPFESQSDESGQAESGPAESAAENENSKPENSIAAEDDKTEASKNASSGPETAEGSSGQELPDAPDFTVYTMDEEEVHLSDFIGKPVIVNFWASWCPPCKAELPDFDEFYKEYGDRIEFLMVNLTDGSRETKAIVSAFLLQTGYTFPVYLDLQGDAAYTYGLYSIPVTVGIDAEGRVKAQRIGSMRTEEIREMIDLLLE